MKRARAPGAVNGRDYHTMLAPFYLRIFQNEKLDIVGVHDPDPGVAADRAKEAQLTPTTGR